MIKANLRVIHSANLETIGINNIQGYSTQNIKWKKMEDQSTYDDKLKETLSGSPLNLLLEDKLTYIGSVLEFLGYSDLRAVENFCSTNNIPVVKVGRKKYIVSLFLDAFIQQEIQNNLDRLYANSDSMLEAVENEDVEFLHKLINDKQEKTPQQASINKNRNNSSTSFIDQVKRA